MNEQKKQKIGSLWKKVSKSGLTYLSGVIDDRKVLVFRVKEKRNDNSPDFQVVLAEPAPAAKPVQAQKPVIDDSDIPF